MRGPLATIGVQGFDDHQTRPSATRLRLGLMARGPEGLEGKGFPAFFSRGPDDDFALTMILLGFPKIFFKPSAGRDSHCSSRVAKSLAQSMTIDGTPSKTASSISLLRRTVLPEPAPASTSVCFSRSFIGMLMGSPGLLARIGDQVVSPRSQAQVRGTVAADRPLDNRSLLPVSRAGAFVTAACLQSAQQRLFLACVRGVAAWGLPELAIPQGRVASPVMKLEITDRSGRYRG